jgi:two-component system response regulator NreC
VITGHYQDLILSNVLNELDPIALVYKSDLENSTFTEMFEDVLQGTPYYSLTVLQLIRKKLASKIVLDRLDKMLLHELYKGQRTKDLTKTIPLSIGGIEKRKRQLKELFNTMHQNDEALINSAIEHGFL